MLFFWGYVILFWSFVSSRPSTDFFCILYFFWKIPNTCFRQHLDPNLLLHFFLCGLTLIDHGHTSFWPAFWGNPHSLVAEQLLQSLLPSGGVTHKRTFRLHRFSTAWQAKRYIECFFCIIYVFSILAKYQLWNSSIKILKILWSMIL